MMLLIVLMSERPSAPPAHGREARLEDVAGVRRELDEDGRLRELLRPARDLLEQLRLLADRRAHAALAHAVRAAEVQLEAVDAGVLAPLDEDLPVVLRLGHQRRDDDVLRVALLDLADLAEVHLERAIGDELDVVEPHQLAAVVVDAAEAARDVHDRVAERLPHGAAPAGVEGAHDLLAAVRGRRRGEPERVRALDAGEVDAQICHELLRVRARERARTRMMPSARGACAPRCVRRRRR